MRLYFTRHGKTEWNQELRFQGMKGDSPLLPESYVEIAELGKRLAPISFSAVYASSSKRAQDTARGILAELKEKPPLILLDDLRELGLGDLEGQKIADSRDRFGENLEAMRADPANYHPEEFNGESFASLIKRGTGAVQQAVDQTAEGDLLFVGHGASLTATIQSLAGRELKDIRSMGGLLNSSLSILETGEKGKIPPYRLILWNDTTHLS